MEPALPRIGWKGRRLTPSIMALAFAAVMGGTLVAPAWARDDDGDRGRGVSRDGGSHYRDAHHGRRDRGYYDSPSYVYAPPPVYYAPPQGPPAIDFIIPLRFR